MEIFVYNGTDASVRLDKYIMLKHPELKFGMLKKYWTQNKVKLNGKKQALSTKLTVGDEIKLFLPQALAAAKLHVLYEDENYIAVNKPAGMPSMSKHAEMDNNPVSPTALYTIRQYLQQNATSTAKAAFQPVLCHRLDVGTSGVLLAAKNEKSEQFALQLIRMHQFKKEYLVAVAGKPPKQNGTLEHWLQKNSTAAFVKTVPAGSLGAKKATLQYTVLYSNGHLSLLEVELITGRTHQIRVQMAAIGCPVIGDEKYGNFAINRQSNCQTPCLCAKALTFPTNIENELFQQYAGLRIETGLPWFYPAIQQNKL